MKIAIDARLYNQSGIGRYLKNLIEQLQKIDKENNYFILLKKKEYDNLEFSKNFEKVLADIPWYGFAEQIKIPKILKSLDVDLVHFPHFNVPILYSGKFIVTIHDLIHQHFKMQRASALNPVFYRIKQSAYRLNFSKAVKRALKILTPSQYVKDDLLNNWKIDPKKVLVTHEAVEDRFFELSKKMTDGKCKEVLEKYNIKPPFLFYVGNAHPHKNVGRLIESFLMLNQDHQNLKLVLAGNDHYFWKNIRNKYEKEKNIIFTGFINDEELVAIYKKATLFVTASLAEGFGIPILEAMSVRTPVVSSNTTSLPEVGGSAAVYFDPHETGSCINAIKKVLNDKSLQDKLIEKGEKRVKDFSWKKMAEQTLEVYIQCK